MVEVHEARPPTPAPMLATKPPAADLSVVVGALERSDRHARNRALIAAGSVLLASGYAASLTLGALTLNGYGDNGNSIISARSATLLQPGPDPLVSGPLAGPP